MSASERLNEIALLKPGGHWDEEVGVALRRALPEIVAVVQALELAQAKQQEALAIIRKYGFVFNSIGAEPGNFEHLAFSLYTDLCEIDSHAAPALAALDAKLSHEPLVGYDKPMFGGDK